MLLKLKSLILVCLLTMMSAIKRALSTILSSREGTESSSSGLHNIYPICSRFKPAFALFWSKVELILMFRRHIGLKLKVRSSIEISFIMSICSMYARDAFENGLLAYSHDSQVRSYVCTASRSGMLSP